jgi:hypothetical protein
VVFTVGFTTTVAPVIAPGFHVYEVAPEAISVPEVPTQIDGEAGVIVMLGTGLTTSVTVALPGQPNPVTPSTVYVVVMVGETTTALPVIAPGVHV